MLKQLIDAFAFMLIFWLFAVIATAIIVSTALGFAYVIYTVATKVIS